MFAHNIMSFQRGIRTSDGLGEFKQFLKKESKATVEQSKIKSCVRLSLCHALFKGSELRSKVFFFLPRITSVSFCYIMYSYLNS